MMLPFIGRLEPISFLCLLLLLAQACGNNLAKEQNNLSETSPEFTSLPDQALDIPSYIAWVKSQTGITYSEQENQDSKISLMYKPLQLEAALSLNNSDAHEFKNLLKIKEGYHYILIESLDKIPSASNLNAGKKELLSYVKSHLTVIENQNDTLSNLIIEEFPSSIMNKPDQLLLLVKKQPIEKLQVIINSKPKGLEDVKITLTKQQIESFPQIKL